VSAVDDIWDMPEACILSLNLAATVAMVVLLELKFQFCKDLWVMIASKARDYVDRQFSNRSATKDEIYQFARKRLQNLHVPKLTSIPMAPTVTGVSFIPATPSQSSADGLSPATPQDRLHQAPAMDLSPNDQVAMSKPEPAAESAGRSPSHRRWRTYAASAVRPLRDFPHWRSRGSRLNKGSTARVGSERMAVRLA